MCACGTRDPGSEAGSDQPASNSASGSGDQASTNSDDGSSGADGSDPTSAGGANPGNGGGSDDVLASFPDVVPEDGVDTSIEIAAGEFAMGCSSVDDDCRGDEHPFRIVELHDFEIQKYEVTVAQYRECVADGGCSEPGTGEQCNYERFDHHPVNCISWQQANDYCEWLGWRLPSEAEWERSARGAAGLVFPWGNQEADCDHAIMKYCSADGTAPVGSLPGGASPDGVMDMAGNLWEWINDWYAVDYYTEASDEDPAGPETGEQRMVRGGGFTDINPASLRASYRGVVDPDNAHYTFGVRCVR